jgi:hypothetical protein
VTSALLRLGKLATALPATVAIWQVVKGQRLTERSYLEMLSLVDEDE